jgi:hypothetical protein
MIEGERCGVDIVVFSDKILRVAPPVPPKLSTLILYVDRHVNNILS